MKKDEIKDGDVLLKFEDMDEEGQRLCKSGWKWGYGVAGGTALDLFRIEESRGWLSKHGLSLIPAGTSVPSGPLVVGPTEKGWEVRVTTVDVTTDTSCILLCHLPEEWPVPAQALLSAPSPEAEPSEGDRLMSFFFGRAPDGKHLLDDRGRRGNLPGAPRSFGITSSSIWDED